MFTIRSTHRDRADDHVIQGDGIDITLTCLPDEAAPTAFSLYVWSLPFGPDGDALLRVAIEQLTGKPVREVRWETGNGQGWVYVVYD